MDPTAVALGGRGRRGIERIREAYEAAGREPQRLEISFSLPIVADDLDRSLEGVPALREAGVTTLQVTVGRFVAGPHQAPAFCERLAAAFDPYR